MPDSPQSIIFDQAENRLYTEMALPAWFVCPRLNRASADETQRYAPRIVRVLRRQRSLQIGAKHDR